MQLNNEVPPADLEDADLEEQSPLMFGSATLVQVNKYNGVDVLEEVLDVSVDCDFKYQTFSEITLDNRHFCTHEKT